LFSDANVANGNYVYRLKQIDFNGVFDFSNEIEVEVNAPAEYSLAQNYPNPFNPSTTINYSIAEAGLVKIAVFNLLGQEVALIENEFKEAGQYNVIFNASTLTSGVYFYTIDTPQFKQTKKMLLAK
jgi:hypothetical protein